MNRKLLFFAMSCLVFFVGCSAQEDFNNFTSKPVDTSNPDIIAKPVDSSSDPVVDKDPKVIKKVVIAHRGAWKKKNLPQNSIASLREAIRLGCKGSEFDIFLTIDDSLVVCHDPTYNGLNVQDSKYSDLITLKLSNGETLPTLREYIIVAKQNNSTTQLFCEFKNNGLGARRKIIVKKALECVNKLNAEELVVYTSFDYVILKQIRALNPSADIRYLTGDIAPEQLKLDKISGILYYIDDFKKHLDWIESAKKNNIILGAGIANDVVNIRWCLENDMDGIVTDEPELVISYQNTY